MAASSAQAMAMTSPAPMDSCTLRQVSPLMASGTDVQLHRIGRTALRSSFLRAHTFPSKVSLPAARAAKRDPHGRAGPCSAVLSQSGDAATAGSVAGRPQAGADDGESVEIPASRRGLRGKKEADVVVIGSGLGGLCAGAMLARYGKDVLVLESHSIPGGAAHSFERQGFHFDSGPSLFSGLSSRGLQANPLAQVLEALDERVECIKYDSWMCYLPEGEFLTRIGPDDFFQVLKTYVDDEAVADWRKLLDAVRPLSGAAMVLPPAALRADAGVALTAGLRYGGSLLKTFSEAGLQGAFQSTQLLGPFEDLVNSAGIRSPFVRQWVDLLSFLLSGQRANATIAAEIIYMFSEWYKPGCQLDYPVGGTAAIVECLVRGLEKNRGQLALGCHVDEVLLEGGKAVGVRLRDGTKVRARTAVISNASVWDTMRLIPAGAVPAAYQQEALATPECDSFMHLHVGMDSKHAPQDLEIHHIVVNDWARGVDAPQNVVLVSVPSVLDPKLAPPGKISLHAYTPGTEPASVWEGLDRGSKEYKELKEQRSQVMWSALSRILKQEVGPANCDVALVGTPLTHARYLRRHRGTYGPAIAAGKGTFPGPGTPIPGLLCCGDSTFPGIGVPAVAASGFVAANTLTPVWDHWKLLDAVGV